MECPLCDALTQERMVIKDDHAFCIVNLEPLKRGHVMVLPIRHVTELKDLTAQETKSMTDMVDKLTKTLKEKYGEDTIIVLQRGKLSTQPHLHYHVLPSKGALRHLVSTYEKAPYRTKATMQQLKEIRDEVVSEF